jgi:hypothetical protein
MSFINYSSREINCKIVYYGPGLCGKTTNLQYIYNRTNPEAKGKMISLATETERTLFFDFLPLSLGEIRGFKTRFHLYTVPGQVFYDASRKLILKGVDGVVFVADSQMSAWKRTSSRSRTCAPTCRAGLRPRQAALRRPVQQARSAQRRAIDELPQLPQPHPRGQLPGSARAAEAVRHLKASPSSSDRAQARRMNGDNGSRQRKTSLPQ